MGLENAFFEFAAGTSAELPYPDRPEIVFSGRSNVGKSSMINKLLNRKSLARISTSPGKTATINFYHTDFCRFVDLPGYGYARVSHAEKLRWAGLVEDYFAASRNLRLVVQLIDARRVPTADDEHMINFLCEKEIPYVVAASKCDKLNATERRRQTEILRQHCGLGQTEVLFFSSLTGEGAETLRKKILFACRS